MDKREKAVDAPLDLVAAICTRAFGQPRGQELPTEFLAMLAELDRSKR